MQPGDVIADRFEVVHLANAGGMGTVYSALDRKSGVRVALKVLNGCGQQYVDLFAREAGVLAELRHPGIVRYVDHGGTESGDLYLAMEWLEGEDLAERLESSPLSISECVALAIRVADAMGAAHARGVVHRDIKPSNLFLREREVEQVKLLDFGIARSRRGTRPATLTGVIVGTPGYIAPEQALGAKELDSRADVFSFGCVLYECLTGRAAFEGEHVMLLLARLLLDEAPRVRALRSDVPPALDALIARMLAKEANERPVDGTEVAAGFRALLRELGPSFAATSGAAAREPRANADTVPAHQQPREAQRPRVVIEPALEAPAPVALDTPRPVAGKPSPLVGRDREMASLIAVFDECIAKKVTRAVLITAGTGVGKTRLAIDLVARLRERESPPVVWLGRGDPLGSDSALRALGEVIRGALGLPAQPAAQGRKNKLQQRLAGAVARRVAASSAARVADFLGEIVDIPFPSDQSPALRVARQDARLMGDQIKRAVQDWVAAESAAHPIVLVLDDLHWIDRPTAAFVELLLRNLIHRPLFVIALARPEVHARFPDLWRGVATEMPLAGLSREACQAVVDAAAGPKGSAARRRIEPPVSDEALASIAASCGGNPLRLEEMLRAVLDGPGDAEDGDVVVRIAALPHEAKRTLAAAAVLGLRFTEPAITAILKDTTDTISLSAWVGNRQWLSELTRRELVVAEGDDKTYAFTHAKTRDVAYAIDDEATRALAHRRAAAWLERAGRADPAMMVEHFERGREPLRAAGWCGLSAERSLKAHDYPSVLDWVARGIACGAEGELLGTLTLLATEAHKWTGDNHKALESAIEARDYLPSSSPLWCAAVAEIAFACGNLGRHDELVGVFEALSAIGSDQGSAMLIAKARVALQLLHAGRHDLSETLMAPFEGALGDALGHDPEVMASVHRVRAFRAMISGDAGASVREFEAAAERFEEVGDLRDACVQRMNVGYATIELGAYAQAEGALRSGLEAAERMGLVGLMAFGRHNLGMALARQGQLYEARAVETAALDGYVKQGVRRMEGGCRIYLAMILALGCDLEGAEQQARAAIAILENHPSARAQALATLARTLVLRGKPNEALAPATEAMGLLDALGGIEEGESLVRLEYAVAEDATGSRYAARKAIAAARDRLIERANRIQDPTFRASFLREVPENSHTMRLARSWVGPLEESE